MTEEPKSWNTEDTEGIEVSLLRPWRALLNGWNAEDTERCRGVS